jgi:hypothetical protein
VEDELGEAFDTCGEKREMHKRFWWGNLIERDHLEDVGVAV